MWGTFDPNDPEMTWKIGHDFFIWKLHKTSVIRSKQNKGRTINIPKIHYFRAFSLISESAYDKLQPFSRIYYHKVSHRSNKTPFWTSVVVCQIWWGRSEADARGSQVWSSEWQTLQTIFSIHCLIKYICTQYYEKMIVEQKIQLIINYLL